MDKPFISTRCSRLFVLLSSVDLLICCPSSLPEHAHPLDCFATLRFSKSIMLELVLT